MTETEQMQMRLHFDLDLEVMAERAKDRAPTVEEAAARGWLRIEVDDARPLYSLNRSAFIDGQALDADEPIQVVHVLSLSARGEIRGYILARGELRLRLPCYTANWPELDAWVAKTLGARLIPHRGIGPGGMELAEVAHG